MGLKKKGPKEPPGKIEYPYKNEPGSPIMRNGCPWCGLLDYRHTPSCPKGQQERIAGG